MSFSLREIKSATSDGALFKLLSAELQGRLPEKVHQSPDVLVRAIRGLPSGLRAMAAIHRLDVSMAMDDLGWHFHNFHHPELCDETARGLRELGAGEVLEIFEQARSRFEAHWESVGNRSQESLAVFPEWYESSGLEAALAPLNKRLWKICSESPDHGLLRFWLDYARQHPERLLDKP